MLFIIGPRELTVVGQLTDALLVTYQQQGNRPSRQQAAPSMQHVDANTAVLTPKPLNNAANFMKQLFI
jgi:hypothetical protein